MSGAKKPSARDSIAMRAPSRQTTAMLIAGGLAPAAIGAGEIGDDQAFGAVGNAGERQRPARLEPFGGRLRQQGLSRELLYAPSRRVCSRASWREMPMSCAQHGGVVFRGNAFVAADPGIKLGIGHFDQPLEIVERRLIELVDIDVGETADDQIHFAHAAPPGAKQELAAPHIQSFARSFCHDVQRRQSGRGLATGT